jgi:hypothetical protein
VITKVAEKRGLAHQARAWASQQAVGPGSLARERDVEVERAGRQNERDTESAGSALEGRTRAFIVVKSGEGEWYSIKGGPAVLNHTGRCTGKVLPEKVMALFYRHLLHPSHPY